PFIWTATVEDIIKKIERARVKMEQIKPRSTLPRGKKEGGLTVKLSKGHYTTLVGLGSYIVNAQEVCNDCHTNPPYAPGGDPFKGEPEQINVEGYLAGGTAFGPFISRNLTPCEDGEPEWTFEKFLQIMRTGVDLEDDEHPPGNTPLLQVHPWPVLGKMTTCDLRAVYEYLRAIPPRQCEE
ncbi:MAG: hypothetical protein ACREYE_00280, partial [Gammaproteobacteria bacterium]